MTNVHLLLANGDNAGELICHAAEQKGVDFICVGRRGMGALKRLLLGSVSRYVLEHAPCDVMVVKGEYGPEEVHDTTKAQIKAEEEKERARRIAEEKKLDLDLKAEEKFQSDLDRNIARLAEEKERMRRVAELEARHRQEQQERHDKEDKEHPIVHLFRANEKKNV